MTIIQMLGNTHSPMINNLNQSFSLFERLSCLFSRARMKIEAIKIVRLEVKRVKYRKFVTEFSSCGMIGIPASYHLCTVSSVEYITEAVVSAPNQTNRPVSLHPRFRRRITTQKQNRATIQEWSV
jgi:putative transposon-encoded protein